MSMPAAILAVDGNSLGHRAFHSMRDAFADRPHALTGAVASMLATAWRHGPYDGVVVAFDHPFNRRKDDWPEYKANRTTDPAIGPALDRLRDDLERLGMMVVREHGAEADDLLASIVDDCLARGFSCDLLSSDRDMVALVDDHVRLLRPRHRFGDLVVEDPERVRADYGIEPHQYHDLAALRGDTSDGLDGVDGIGPRTAARLLREHGDVEGIYAALGDLPPRIEAALRAARPRVERNLLLMAPIPHLPVDVRACVAAWDPHHMHDVLAAMNESSAGRRLSRAVTDPPPPIAPPPDDADDRYDASTIPSPHRAPGARERSSGRMREPLVVDTVEQAELF